MNIINIENRCESKDKSYSHNPRCYEKAIYKITITSIIPHLNNQKRIYSVNLCMKHAKIKRHYLNYEINNLNKKKNYIQTELL